MLLCGLLLIGADRAPLLAAEGTQGSASEQIERVLSEPEFNQYKKIKRWRWLGEVNDEEDEPPSQAWALFWANLAKLFSDISQNLLWIAVAILIPVVLYLLRKFLPEPRTRKTEDYEPPANLFGLNISPESLPDDIAAAASDLARQGQLRDALSLLYRGTLSVLIHRYRVVVRAGDTEGDCERAAKAGLPPDVSGYFNRLLTVWREAAYAGTENESQTIEDLCRDWARHFSHTGSSQTKPGLQVQA